MPLYQTAAYVFGSTEQAAELFQLRSYGHIYSRISNPTVAAFEERMASLEGGLGAVAFSSGLAAQLGVVLALAQNGDHLVCSQNIYGGTVTQFTVLLKRLGIETTFVPTFASPYLCRPMEHGADIVTHSATKFISGHGTVIGGVVIESGTFPWDGGRFPLLSQPSPGYHDKVFTETFGEYAFLMRLRAEVLRDVGAQMAPMDAWLLLLGLETLPIRMDGHVRNARAIAEFLSKRPEVEWVSYPGFASHPQHALAQKYLPRGAGSIFTFGIRGGREAGRAFIDALELWSHLANVGDMKSLVIHPASTTHSQLGDDEMRKAGVAPESIRLSVGLEDVEDLTWDLDNALKAAVPAPETTPA